MLFISVPLLFLRSPTCTVSDVHFTGGVLPFFTCLLPGSVWFIQEAAKRTIFIRHVICPAAEKWQAGPGRAENDPAEDTYRKITMIHCPGGCCCSGFLWSLSRESLDYIWLMEDFVFGDIRGSAIWSVQMDSVAKDVFSDEMELFLRMEKRLKRLQDKAFTSIAQSIREKSLKFSEKRCWQKNLQW